MRLNQRQKEAYQKAAFICSKVEKSSNKIRQKLFSWKLSEDEARLILEKLISDKYIDDERYSKSFARDKFRFNKWGKIKIAHQLHADKIPSLIIESALKEITDSEYQETLLEILQSKAKEINAVNPYDKKAKLFRFAQSRGFESDLIFSAFDKLQKD